MDERKRAKITENQDFLCENTYSLREILKYLRNYDMFSEKEENDILTGSLDTEDQLRDFYDLVVRKGKRAYGRLIEALRATKNNTVLTFLGYDDDEEEETSTNQDSNFNKSQPLTKPSDKAYAKILRRSLLECCDKTSNLLRLLDALHSEEIISRFEVGVVKGKPTEFEQHSELFGNILPKKSPEKFPTLLKCLRETENQYIEKKFLALLQELGP